METELILYNRPSSSRESVPYAEETVNVAPSIIDSSGVVTSVENVIEQQASPDRIAVDSDDITGGVGISGYNYIQSDGDFSYVEAYNNIPISSADLEITRQNTRSSGGVSLDLKDDISIPITYNILDVREPDKVKTSWSKTVILPGSKTNNRIFKGIYEISNDGWTTIGNTSVYDAFNPKLRNEIIILHKGIQVLKGNLQLKKITRDSVGNIEYEVALTGELTSLFGDIGNTKLTDLNFNEWNHFWDKQTIENSWKGISVKDGKSYYSISSGSSKSISSIGLHSDTARTRITTSSNHNLSVGDWVVVDLDEASSDSTVTSKLRVSLGSSKLNPEFGNEYQVMDVISDTQFTINWFWPVSLPTPLTGITGTVRLRVAKGRGFVYPMIDWGTKYDENTWPVESFVPAFYIKEIWDKIMKFTGSVYDSNFLDSQFFKRLILVQKKKSYDLNPFEFQSRRFQVGLTSFNWTGCSYKKSQTSYYLNFDPAGRNGGSSAYMYPSVSSTKVPFTAETGINGTSSFYDNGRDSDQSFGNWNEDAHYWVVSDTGEYDLTANISMTCFLDMNGLASGDPDGTDSLVQSSTTYRYYPAAGETGSLDNRMIVKARLIRKRGSTTTEIGSTTTEFKTNNSSYWTSDNPNWAFFGRYQPADWKDRNITVSADSRYFAEGDIVWLSVEYKIMASPTSYKTTATAATYNRYMCLSFSSYYMQTESPSAVNISGEWKLRVESQGFIFNSPSPRSSENSLIYANSFLPREMTCREFIFTIIKMFNLHIQEDFQVDRKYYIEPRDDFYKDGSGGESDYIDWTYKVDNNSIDITPIGELSGRYYTFENTKESDYWNKKFLEDRGRDYMKYTFDTGNEFSKSEIKITTPIGSTVMTNIPSDTDVVVPAIFSSDDGFVTKPISNSKPRILIWGGLKPYTAFRGGNTSLFWDFRSNASLGNAQSEPYYAYPYAGTVDNPTDPVNDVNWYNMEDDDFVYWDSARWTNGNLFNKYWKNMMLEISDPASKVITCDVHLTPTDIFNLDFTKIYVIDNNYLRLQKIINYDVGSDGLTRCEFLKLRTPSKYKQESIEVDVYSKSAKSTSTITTRNAGVFNVFNVAHEVAPAKKKEDFGYTNINKNILSTNKTISISGLNNNVANLSNNITINGSGNSVGTGCENININGGNGCVISGGVKNVNLIGTNKVVIEESNTTYINGVRYKDGVSISRCNVINGGRDIAFIRQSQSTNINVIDAGTDIVIPPGGSSYENVIDAGTDRILPDKPELSIAREISQNSKLTLTPGFQSGLDILESIRLNAFNSSDFDTTITDTLQSEL